MAGADGERERLLRAAVELVAEEGYRRAGKREIAERAGVSEQAFERWFAGSDQCLLAAFEQCVEQARAAVAPAVADCPWERART